VTIYRVTHHCFAINFEEIVSLFVLNVFFCGYLVFSEGPKWRNMDILAFLCPNLGV
jgi:hypothetical protein